MPHVTGIEQWPRAAWRALARAPAGEPQRQDRCVWSALLASQAALFRARCHCAACPLIFWRGAPPVAMYREVAPADCPLNLFASERPLRHDSSTYPDYHSSKQVSQCRDPGSSRDLQIFGLTLSQLSYRGRWRVRFFIHIGAKNSALACDHRDSCVAVRGSQSGTTMFLRLPALPQWPPEQSSAETIIHACHGRTLYWMRP